MSDIDPSIELLIEKKFRDFEQSTKKDRHSQNNKIQSTISKHEKSLEKAIWEMRKENKELLWKINWLFAKKWVERMVISVWVFIIVWVSTTFWNVFNGKLTEYLKWLV